MRRPKPFFRTYTQSWYVTIKRKQIPLGKDEEAAWQKYHELMASQEKLSSNPTVAAICDAYLQWLLDHRSRATFDKARHYLSLFVKFIGIGRRVASLQNDAPCRHRPICRS